MFEKEIEFIYSYNLNKIEKLGSFITFEQLATANLHPALLQYVSAEIDYLIYEDRQKLLRESLFDYSGEKINNYFNLIGEEIKLTKRFSKDYITKLLQHATSFNVNYTIRPHWSLLQFIFENESEKYVSEIKQILNYLYYYPFYKRILINYFNKKHLYKISESDLAELLNKIDKINIEKNFDELVNESLKNIINFVYTGEVDNKHISKKVFELFLIDKGFEDSSTIIDEKLPGSSEERFKVDDLKGVIKSIKDKKEKIDENSNDFEEAKINIDEDKDKISFKEGNIEESEKDSNIIESIEESERIKGQDAEDIKNEYIETELEEAEEYEPPEVDEMTPLESSKLQEVSDMISEEDTGSTDYTYDNGGERLILDNDEITDSDLVELDEDESRHTEEEIGNDKIDDETDLSDEKDFIAEGTTVSYPADDLIPLEPDDKISGDALEDPFNEESVGKTSEEDEFPNMSQNIDEKIVDNPEDEIFEVEVNKQFEETKSLQRNIDVNELLKNKKVNSILEYLFDYDMEEFTKTIDKISQCKTKYEAIEIIDSIAQNSYLDESAREIRIFKKIILKLFE